MFLLAGDLAAAVTFDGQPVSGVAALLTRLLATTDRVRATVHPAVERYGAALKAEFNTIPLTPLETPPMLPDSTPSAQYHEYIDHESGETIRVCYPVRPAELPVTIVKDLDKPPAVGDK